MKKRRNNALIGRGRQDVRALFLDYDGTIGPLGIPRSKSKVSPENLAVLCQISLQIPVAIITTKSLSFVVKRTPFAHAWSSLGGLEVKIGSTVTRAACLRTKRHGLMAALECAETFCDNGLSIEEKKDREKNTAAFSVDWRNASNRLKAEERASSLISHLETLPVVVTTYERQPFFDVFPCPVDKGKAVRELKQKLGLHEGILYMGDSTVDNAAFEEADIAVGVIHEETPDSLVCEYFVRFEDVSAFFRTLLQNGFRFNPRSDIVINRAIGLRLIRRSPRAE